MADYVQAAIDLKARLDAKTRRRSDLNDFFEGIRSNIHTEIGKANVELARNGAPQVEFRQESPEERTIELACGRAIGKISQDRSVPSIGAIVTGEAGEKTITFIILIDESPVTAQRVSLTPALEAKVGPPEIAAAILEELIMGAP